VRYTPDGKLVCVALLDRTIKVFFTNTLKHHLTLYGHVLPALSISISLDSKLLLSTSADRTCKIWGLDFGDCHRSIRAHPESIMTGMFELGKDERDWHNFWTAGKDGGIKYWDGDTWENILSLKGHHGEVWSMVQNSRGDWIASAGRDKSIRIWSRTDEQVFLEEEREKEIEDIYEEGLVEGLERTRIDDEDMEVTQAGKQTVETLNAGERIVEALELGREDRALMEQYEQKLRTKPKTAYPTRNPIFTALGVSAEKFVLNVVEKVKPASLQDALLILPFEHVEIMIGFITIWATKVRPLSLLMQGWNIKLTTHILTSLIRIHHAQIVSSRSMRPVLDQLRLSLRQSLTRERELTGWNTAGLGYIKRELIESGVVGFNEEIPLEKGAKKRSFPSVA
jgi:U3 small nucleolar RNA-associated protein 12